MKSIGLLVVFFLAGAQSAKVCTSNYECQPGECCQILSEYMVVSKRDVFGAPTTPFPSRMTGTCQPYTLEGQSCDPFRSMNGFCSCEPGTDCRRARVSTTPRPTPFPTTTPYPTHYPTTTPRQTRFSTTTPRQTRYPTTTRRPTRSRTTTPRPSRFPTTTPRQTRFSTTTAYPTRFPTTTRRQTRFRTTTPYPTRFPTTTPYPTRFPITTPTPYYHTFFPFYPTTTPASLVRKGRTIGPPPMGYAREFTCIRRGNNNL